MTVRASTLISVQWPPDPVSQGPDTLVLSVGTYYVDLRVDRHDGSIYWALAGRRLVISEEPRKVKFTHEIDSHHITPTTTEEDGEGAKEEEEEVADEGLFTKLPNGDDLEIGEMPAPHRGGKVSPYREVWRELSIDLDHSGDKHREACWILESLDIMKQKRTFYCRAGKFFLALRRTERQGSDQNGSEVEYSAIRQEQTPAQIDGNKEWTTKYSIGKDVDDMFRMSTSSEFVLENVKGSSPWKLDDQVALKNKSDGAVREVYVVRAVA